MLSVLKQQEGATDEWWLDAPIAARYGLPCAEANTGLHYYYLARLLRER